METEGGCLGNRFIQPKQVTQHSMQPLYATTYGNGKKLFGQPLMKIEGYCLATTYSNSVLQFTPTVSYSLRQQCLTVYANNVLQFTPTVSYIMWQ
jgi:hypothetical protein